MNNKPEKSLEESIQNVKTSKSDIQIELDKAFLELFNKLERCRIQIERDSPVKH